VDAERVSGPRPAFLFDLDGTLIDSVYQHVVAWREALEAVGINISVWKLHRRIGMSGSLLMTALAREIGQTLDAETLARVSRHHQDAYLTQIDNVRALPAARDLLDTLTENDVPWAICTSGPLRYASRGLELLGLDEDAPLVTRDRVRYAKPDPDLFLAGADLPGVPIAETVVVGDSVWDLLAARRARALGVGVLCGGYGREELLACGAYRVYEDPADLLSHIDELGVRRPI
jgi:HAD superfamily hydrolase (TIGR01549 family)